MGVQDTTPTGFDPVLAEDNAHDPYTYRGTSVLINKRGYRDAAALRLFEGDRVSRRAADFPSSIAQGSFDVAHFCSIHKHLFQDVYGWAGEFRSVNLSKGQSSFANASSLEGYGKRIFGQLAKEDFLRVLDKPTFVRKLSRYYAEMNAWHPFREGNGRTTRIFIDQVAENAGYRPDLRGAAKEGWDLAAALSMRGDLVPIHNIFSSSVRPLRAVAFEVMEGYSAIQRFPELRGAYDLYDAMTRRATGKFPNNRQAREHFATQAKAALQLQLDGGRVPNATALNQEAAHIVRSRTLAVEKAGPRR